MGFEHDMTGPGLAGPIVWGMAALQFGLIALLFVAVWIRGGFNLGPEWRSFRKDGVWVMRRKIDGKVETRSATASEAAAAQETDAVYDNW